MKLLNRAKIHWHAIVLKSGTESFCCLSEEKVTAADIIERMHVWKEQKTLQEMFGLLQVCLLCVFVEGCQAGTQETEGSS